MIGAKRFAIDSISALELAVAPDFREDFREALYRMLQALTGIGVTTVLIVEITEGFDQMTFSPHGVSFLTENILRLRYTEIRGELRKVLTIVKMRRSAHAVDLRTYDIGSSGIIVSAPLHDFRGVLTGSPEFNPGAPVAASGLTEDEVLVLLRITEEQSTAEALVTTSKLTARVVGAALRRLELLGYVRGAATPGERQPTYRAVAPVRSS